MSWEAVRGALATRVRAVEGVERLFETDQYVINGLESDALLQKLGEQTDSGWRIHFWIFRRSAATPAIVPDDGRVRKWTHTVQIVGTRVMEGGNESESEWQAIGEAVAANLNSGDRTLGGACITHGDASLSYQNIEWNRKLIANEVTISLQIEENVSGPQG